MSPQPSTYTPNAPENVPKVLQNSPQTASRKGFPTPSKPYQKGKQATYKLHQPSFPKQPIRHTPSLQLTAQKTEKARSNGPKEQKARFHRRNTEAGGSRKADGNRFLSENIQACLRDFQTGTASMARKRHLASNARGLFGFCLMTLVTTRLFRSIRLIRGRKGSLSSGVLPSRQRFHIGLYPRALPPVTQGSTFQAPEC